MRAAPIRGVWIGRREGGRENQVVSHPQRVEPHLFRLSRDRRVGGRVIAEAVQPMDREADFHGAAGVSTRVPSKKPGLAPAKNCIGWVQVKARNSSSVIKPRSTFS